MSDLNTLMFNHNKMSKRMTSKKEKSIKDTIMYGVIVVLSAMSFCIIFGVNVLNPCYVDWLMKGIDVPQHYLGWVAYRNSPWVFPLGMGNQLSYPAETSVIFSDSIPLLAFFFKLLSPILPRNFQYSGWVGLLSFVMQGVLSAHIFRHFSDNHIAIVICSLFFSMSPIAIYRMYSQVTLTCCWSLLIGLELLFCYDKYRTGKRIYFIIFILGVLSGGTQLYFILMNGIILSGVFILDLLSEKRIVRGIVYLVEYVIIAGGMVWIMGGFSSSATAAGPGLGNYSFNLNGFVNPMGWSSILPDLNVHAPEQIYGFAYYGAGLLGVIIWACIITLKKHIFVKIWNDNKALVIAIAIVGMISLIIAASPKVTLFGAILVMYELPKKLMEIWAVFRTSQRVIWVLWYIIAIASCLICLRKLKGRTAIVVFSLFLALQIYDLHVPFQKIHEQYAKMEKYESPLCSNIWEELAQDSDIKHVVCSRYFELEKMYPLAGWALENSKTYNIFYFARTTDFDQEKYTNSLLLNPTIDNMYVFDESEESKCINYNLNYVIADGFIIGTVKER